MSETAEILTNMRELLAIPERWTTGAWARTKSGAVIGANCEGAVCWCLIGSAIRVTNNVNAHKAIDQISRVVGDSVIEFNDEHSHAEVLAAIDKAIELAKAESNG